MRIIDIRHKTVPIDSAISNAYIDFSRMTASIVAIVSDLERGGERLVGYGFHSNGRYGQTGPLSERFVPRLLEAKPEALTDDGGVIDPELAWDVMMKNEKPGGHGERSVAVGALDMALWDLCAKAHGQPLHRIVADRFGDGSSDEQVEVYAAGGYYYPGKDLAELADEIRSYLELGYETVKIKIGGASLADDLRRIEAVIDLVGQPGRVAVDANGRFGFDRAREYADALAPYGLRWYEEPGDPLDYALQAHLAELYDPPLATGENLFSHQDVRNLLRHGGMRPDRDILQMDPSLSYGLVEFHRMANEVRRHGWSLRAIRPHGGHQFALHIAAGLKLGGNESYPHVFQPFGGFADDVPVIGGRVRIPDAPGIGIERKPALRNLFDELPEGVGKGGRGRAQGRSGELASELTGCR